MKPGQPTETIVVHGTRITADETLERYREKIARITLDSMVQFVGLLDAEGTVLEINKVALDAVGQTLADVQGRPFWTTFWWQVSPEINQGIRDAVARAAQGEFVRWDTPLFASPDGSITIIIDASVMPVKDDRGRVVYLACEGRDITQKKAYEQEIARQREELAELDKLKTQFFANISHEFRTPLTLMISPLEDVLAERAEADPRLELAHRNSLRLLKLVNTLLDFSRIEAGRIDASYEPTELSALTAELASNFRSAIERAGMTLTVECEPLPEPAYVDREMWEKIVLNLLSNAFKFTLQGGIDVSVRAVGRAAELEVKDSGTGIPPEELPKIFERFHRVKGARGRSYEGSGIGLALVQELARLHGGSVTVASEMGRGSVFRVRIPLGKDHLPAERIAAARRLASTGVRADAFVAEALRWLPDAPANPEQGPPVPAPARARVLLADDNSDLRDYVRRLLETSYEVEVVEDGVAALAAARARRPDLVITDVMMPKLDGFGLIGELRADAALATVPVIVLSARAGEEARLEGLHRGADDYVVKPFSARELVGRVAAILRSEAMREGAERALRKADQRKDEFLATLSHELRNPLAPLRNSLQLVRLQGDHPNPAAYAIMERQLNHLVRLVDDLLEMSRITRGLVDLRRERVELSTIVRNAVETSQPLIQAGGHRLDVSLPGQALWLEGDPVRLTQVLSNLLNNAAKYTGDGGSIALSALREGDTAVIRVRDNGYGITEEGLGRIFEMFSREVHAGPRSHGGLGIGLTLSRRLTEMHGGTIEARSEGPGHGSEFTLRFPLAPDSTRAADIAPAVDRLPSALRVLVVDDNADAAESLGLLLEALGAEVSVVNDGAAAIEAFASRNPSVVVLDLGMPQMDGFDLARALRNRFQDRRPTIIALTGHGQPEDRRKAVAAGVDHHLVKPVQLKKLQDLLSSVARSA